MIYFYILLSAAHRNSSFDIVISGLLTPSKASHDTSLLGEVCRILRPKGKIVMQEMARQTAGVTGSKSKDKLVSLLKLSGFMDISEVRILCFFPLFFLCSWLAEWVSVGVYQYAQSQED